MSHPAIAFLIAYLSGAVPFSFLMGKLYGVDIRTVGSGNIGATNLKRAIAGRRLAGVSTRVAMLLDGLKGFLPAWLLAGPCQPAGIVLTESWMRVGLGLTAVLGHTFPVFLKFRGGKGVATSAGAVFAIAPAEAAVALAVWAGVRFASGYVSAASCVAALALPVAAGIIEESPWGAGLPVMSFAIVAAVLVVVRHRSNLVRLWEGTEPKADAKAEKGPVSGGGPPQGVGGSAKG